MIASHSSYASGTMASLVFFSHGRVDALLEPIRSSARVKVSRGTLIRTYVAVSRIMRQVCRSIQRWPCRLNTWRWVPTLGPCTASTDESLGCAVCWQTRSVDALVCTCALQLLYSRVMKALKRRDFNGYGYFRYCNRRCFHYSLVKNYFL